MQVHCAWFVVCDSMIWCVSELCRCNANLLGFIRFGSYLILLFVLLACIRLVTVGWLLLCWTMCWANLWWAICFLLF